MSNSTKSVFFYVSPYETSATKGQNIFERCLIKEIMGLIAAKQEWHLEILTAGNFSLPVPDPSKITVHSLKLSKSTLGHIYFQIKLTFLLLYRHWKWRSTSKVMYLRYHPALIAPLFAHFIFGTPYAMRTGPVLPNLEIYKKDPSWPVFMGIKLVMGIFVRRSQRIITVTSKIRDWVIRTFSTPQEKCAIIPNGVDCDTLREEAVDRRKWGLRDDAVVGGFVGHIYEDQGLETVIRALASLDSKLLQKIQFLIVGDGPQIPYLRRLTEDLKLQTNIIFSGKVPYELISSAVSSCDFMLAPFTKRTFEVTGSSALKIYESLACNRAILASESSDHEFLRTNSLGRLLEPENIDKWAGALSLVAAEGIEKTNGRDYVLRHHSYATIARTIFNHTEKLKER